jgi:hypothetical protein
MPANNTPLGAVSPRVAAAAPLELQFSVVQTVRQAKRYRKANHFRAVYLVTRKFPASGLPSRAANPTIWSTTNR